MNLLPHSQVLDLLGRIILFESSLNETSNNILLFQPNKKINNAININSQNKSVESETVGNFYNNIIPFIKNDFQYSDFQYSGLQLKSLLVEYNTIYELKLKLEL